jgi:hypothetical protein
VVLTFFRVGNRKVCFIKDRVLFLERNKYLYCLPNQENGMPNCYRKKRARELGLFQEDGHFFDKEKCYCISEKVVLESGVKVFCIIESVFGRNGLIGRNKIYFSKSEVLGCNKIFFGMDGVSDWQFLLKFI